MNVVKINILDSLIGHEVSCELIDGGSVVTGILVGVSHQDRWDDLLFDGMPPVRSNEILRLYDGDEAVWPPGAEGSLEDTRKPVMDDAGYSRDVLEQALSLMDRVVEVTLRDQSLEIGKLEAVTPYVEDRLPTLHVSPLDVSVGDPVVRVIQLSEVTGVVGHTLTHAEAESIITEEGEKVAKEPATETPPPDGSSVESGVEPVDPVHSEEDTQKAFGLEEKGSGEESRPSLPKPPQSDNPVDTGTKTDTPGPEVEETRESSKSKRGRRKQG